MKSQPKIKSVIVGVDFSKYSKLAALHARSIAEKLKLPLVFVHIYEDPVVSEQNDTAVKKSLNEYYTKRVISQYKPHKGDTVVVKCGVRIHEEILSIAKNFKQPLIVVADRGAGSKIARAFLGTVAERLVLQSPYPVFVHKGHKTNYPRKVLIPIDFSKRSKHAVEGTKNLQLKDSTIEFYHVLQMAPPILDYHDWQYLYQAITENNTKQLGKFKKKYPDIRITETESNNVPGSIRKKSESFDVIAISPREHKGMLGNFGSVTSKLVRTGDTSVLAVP